MAKSHNIIAMQLRLNRLPFMFIISLLPPFVSLAGYSVTGNPVYYPLAGVLFVVDLVSVGMYGFLAVPYRGNSMKHANTIVIGEGEVDIHYIKGNADESKDIKGDLGRKVTRLLLRQPTTFETTGEPDATEIEIRHYDDWDNRVGRSGGDAFLDNIAYFNRDSETMILAPLEPTDETGKDGVHHWIPTFDLLLTVNKDAANPAMMEAILLAQKMMYIVKTYLSSHPTADPEAVYGAVSKGLWEALRRTMEAVDKERTMTGRVN